METSADRRRLERYSVALHARIAVRTAAHANVLLQIAGEMHSISRGGAGVRVPSWALSHFYVGQPIDITVARGNHSNGVVIHAVVVWCRHDQIGLRFTKRARPLPTATLYQQAITRSIWYDPRRTGTVFPLLRSTGRVSGRLSATNAKPEVKPWRPAMLQEAARPIQSPNTTDARSTRERPTLTRAVRRFVESNLR